MSSGLSSSPAPISVARLSEILNVSPATVSRVLNDRPGIGEATRQRVMEAVRVYGTPKLKKRKEVTAKVAQEARMIGFLVSPGIRRELEEGNDFYGRHLMAIQEEANRFHYYVTPFNIDTLMKGSELVLPGIDQGHLAGIVAEHIPEDIMEQMSARVPLVVMNGPFYYNFVDAVLPDVRHAARLHLRHLYDLGHRRIAYFGAAANWQSKVYLNEFRCYGKTLGLELAEECIGDCDFGYNEHIEAIEAFLDRCFSVARRPTALVTFDHYAVHLWKRCVERGLQVPKDLSIIGYDDSLPQEVRASYPLSSYRQNFEIMGREAVRLLLDRIEHPHLVARRLAVAGELLLRQSTAVAAG